MGMGLVGFHHAQRQPVPAVGIKMQFIGNMMLLQGIGKQQCIFYRYQFILHC